MLPEQPESFVKFVTLVCRSHVSHMHSKFYNLFQVEYGQMKGHHDSKNLKYVKHFFALNPKLFQFQLPSPNILQILLAHFLSPKQPPHSYPLFLPTRTYHPLHLPLMSRAATTSKPYTLPSLVLVPVFVHTGCIPLPNASHTYVHTCSHPPYENLSTCISADDHASA